MRSSCPLMPIHLEVRVVFLDISKAFDKVWHESLVFNMNSNGIRGKLLSLLFDLLDGRYQRILLNGKTSEWSHVVAGVPHGSVLGPLMFLLYINDIIIDIKCDIRIFADDVSLFHIVEDTSTSLDDIKHDLNTISVLANQWRLRFNPDITKQAVAVIFSTKTKPPLHTPPPHAPPPLPPTPHPTPFNVQ